MRLWIVLFSLLVLAACASAQSRSDFAGTPGSGDFSFTGVTPTAPAESEKNACPDAAFPGGASLDSERDGALTFFCEH
jgi:hypothetical protein